jgi:hypothetical protein
MPSNGFADPSVATVVFHAMTDQEQLAQRRPTMSDRADDPSQPETAMSKLKALFGPSVPVTADELAAIRHNARRGQGERCLAVLN